MERHRWHWQAPAEPVIVRPADRLTAAPSNGRPGKQWLRTTHGRYVPAATNDSIEQRILEQSSRLRPGQAVTGWAALRLWGAGLFDGLASDGRTPLPVPLAVGPRGRLEQGLGAQICHDRLPAADLFEWNGVGLTSVPRATFDAVRRTADVRSAVVVIDTVLGAGLTTPDTLNGWVSDHHGWHGVRRMRSALRLARTGVRSPRETELRLTLELDFNIRGLLVNHTVHRRDATAPDELGIKIGEVDLLDPEAGMVFEFDGEDHRHPAQRAHDTAKQEALEDEALMVVHLTSADLDSPKVTGDRVKRKRRAARFLAPSERTWVAQPPAERVNAVMLERWEQARRLAS